MADDRARDMATIVMEFRAPAWNAAGLAKAVRDILEARGCEVEPTRIVEAYDFCATCQEDQPPEHFAEYEDHEVISAVEAAGRRIHGPPLIEGVIDGG